MNALELADELETNINSGLRFTAATMLRTIPALQAEIEALRKSHIELERGIVKDLNQRQSAEPVAWINKVTLQYLTELGYSAKVYPKRSDGDIPLYTHPVKELFKDAENRDELIGQEFETYLEKLTQDFKEGFKEGVLFCEDVARRPALYGQDTHPVKEQLTDKDLKRAVQMLVIASEYIRKTDPYGEMFYGGCIADDCESIAESLRKAQEK